MTFAPDIGRSLIWVDCCVQNATGIKASALGGSHDFSIRRFNARAFARQSSAESMTPPSHGPAHSPPMADMARRNRRRSSMRLSPAIVLAGTRTRPRRPNILSPARESCAWKTEATIRLGLEAFSSCQRRCGMISSIRAGRRCGRSRSSRRPCSRRPSTMRCCRRTCMCLGRRTARVNRLTGGREPDAAAVGRDKPLRLDGASGLRPDPAPS